MAACSTVLRDLEESVPEVTTASTIEPNILFILTDGLGFHQVGAYGQS
jgi:hypothetical protein